MQVLAPLVLLGLLVASVLWVLNDARVRADHRRAVIMRIGDLQIDRPEVWAAGCLVLWILFFPLYLKARSES